MEKEEKIILDIANNKEAGATMIEYALLAALIAVVCIGAVSGVGTTTSGVFTNIDNELSGAAGGGGDAGGGDQ